MLTRRVQDVRPGQEGDAISRRAFLPFLAYTPAMRNIALFAGVAFWASIPVLASAADPAAAVGAPVAARARDAGLVPALRRTFALTWLNPHVYLDTVVLLGSIANTHGHSGRWAFAVGAAVGSTLWFTGLGFGARFAALLLTTPRAWQVLDLLIAATMLAIAAKLAI